MKALLVMGLFTLTTSTFAAVVKGYDAEQSCTLYRVAKEDSNNKFKVKAGETVTYAKAVYGLSFEEMEVNFENREAKVQVMMNIVLGFNKPVVAEKSAISADNANFTFLINQLNRKISKLEKVCITSDNKIVYAKIMPAN